MASASIDLAVNKDMQCNGPLNSQMGHAMYNPHHFELTFNLEGPQRE